MGVDTDEGTVSSVSIFEDFLQREEKKSNSVAVWEIVDPEI